MIEYPLLGYVSWKVRWTLAQFPLRKYSDSILGSEVELDILSNKIKSRRDENFRTTNLYHYYQMLKMFRVMNNSPSSHKILQQFSVVFRKME
jgi:hypothetical protein